MQGRGGWVLVPAVSVFGLLFTTCSAKKREGVDHIHAVILSVRTITYEIM